MPTPAIKDLTFGDIKTILAAAIGIREWNIDDVSGGFVYYTTDVSTGVTSIRSTFKRSYTIGDDATGTKVTLGDAVQVVKRTQYEPLVIISSFSLDEAEVTFSDDGTVLRSGKVFEVGDYPDKGFSLTEAEADAAIAAFAPVPNDLEHKPTILSGKLGDLRKIWRTGKDLFGTVAIPKWLHDSGGSHPIKTSLAWAKDSKRIIGNGLVLNPRIPDAQLMAAFSAANNPIPEGGTITMKVKDLINRFKAHFSTSGVPDELKDIDLDKIDFSGDAPSPTAAAVAPVLSADTAKFTSEIEALRAENTKLGAELAAKAAAEFADGAIKNGKAFPAERDSLMALFTQARRDDGAGIACFAANGEASTRVAELTKSINVRPSHNLTAEEIVGIEGDKTKLLVLGSSAQFSDDADKPTPDGQKITPEREQKLAQFSGVKEDK